LDDTTSHVLFGAVAPLVIAVVCATMVALRPRVAWLVPLGLGGGALLAFFALYGWPREQWEHVAFVAAAGTAIGVVMAMSGQRPGAGGGRVRSGALLALAVLVTAAVWPVLRREPWAIRVVPAVGTLILALALDPLAARRPGPRLLVALTMALAASAAVVLLSGFMKLAVPYGALVPATLVLAVASIWRPRPMTAGIVAVVAPMLVVVPLVARLYMMGDPPPVPVAAFVLPTAAPLLVWLGELPPLRRVPRWLLTVTLWLAVAAVCATAIVLAARGGTIADADDPYADMYQEMMGER
jgi:hypothetical protein